MVAAVFSTAASTCDALHASPSSHFRTRHACAHACISGATRGDEERNSGIRGIERDKFIVFWKELAITGSNMQ